MTSTLVWTQATSRGTVAYTVELVQASALKVGDLVLDNAQIARSTYLGRVTARHGNRLDIEWMKWEDESYNDFLFDDRQVWKATRA